MAQLADATKALEESQEQLRVLNEKWEQILAEKEYLQVSACFFFLCLESSLHNLFVSIFHTCALGLFYTVLSLCLFYTHSCSFLSLPYPLSALRTPPPAALALSLAYPLSPPPSSPPFLLHSRSAW